jgi:hypothetical protein
MDICHIANQRMGAESTHNIEYFLYTQVCGIINSQRFNYPH